MLCSYKDCKGASEPVRMGNVGTLCPDCRTIITNALWRVVNTSPHDALGGYLEDYIRIFLILSTPALFLQKMRKFAAYIAQGTPYRMSAWFGLGRARGLSYWLKSYESICHFPDVEVIPTGVLSKEEFYEMVAAGVMWKDVGAGINHGLYSHRLQWHGVLAWVTNDFTVAKADGWDHGGYDLFVSFGSTDSARLNLWGKVFDASYQGAFRAPEEVEPALKEITEISSRIDTKYEKYHEGYKRIMNHAGDIAMEEVATKKITMQDAGRRAFDITDSVWGTYYFARRGIKAAIPADKADYEAFAQKQGLPRTVPEANDPSKRFAAENIVLEMGNKIIRIEKQKRPTPEEIASLRLKSGVSLNRS